MPQKPNKTTENQGDVGHFIASVADAGRREDALVLLDLFEVVTGFPPRMWGPSIIGFGSYHYQYDSGREGDFMRCGFSPRKANMVVYLTGGYENPETAAKIDALRTKLGKHKLGKSCLYFGRLSGIDLDILKQMIRVDMASRPLT
ncbi:DUF1801 domain-containing protein [Sphingorhabdus arenilitoris]|uniref:DUF1801 domain-containing protein n=1 Tax=Sphingorhabdus arenilitoris TaxID=1490041 RepID=A0ABV8RJ47_9SPHN